MARRFGPGFIATEGQGAQITVSTRGRKKDWEARYTPAPEAITIAKQIDKQFVPPAKALLLARGDREGKEVVLHPHILDAASPRFLLPRYETLLTITLVGFGFLDEIEDLESLRTYLATLPPGMIRDPYYGLGLAYDIRQIVAAVEELDIIDLRIIKGGRGNSRVTGKTYELPFTLFDSVRREIGRVHEKAVSAAWNEKAARVHDRLLTPIDEQKFPTIGHPYEPGAIGKAIGDGLRRGLEVSAADATTLVEATAHVIGKISQREPGRLLKLNEAVETVTLQSMISQMQTRINVGHSEENWQKFLVNNAFILRLAFGVPVLLFHEQATVGGRAYHGSGDKRADFLMQAAKTGNLSIVEIKTPQTELLAKREYRGGIFPPHSDLTGAVAQVLDQRWQLQQNNRALADNRRRQTIDLVDDRPRPEVYAVQCVIVAGRSPSEPNAQKSFELYRNNLTNVLVLTYDELVLKLATLLEILRDPEATDLNVPTLIENKPDTRKRSGSVRRS